MSRSLVELAQHGDRDAYEQLARGAARRMFLVASRILRDTDAAEDAVQQALVSIWRDLPSLRDPDRFDAWTYSIVVRACRTEGRRTGRTMIVDLSDELTADGDDIGDVAVRDTLGRAFEMLSQDHRAVVVLNYLVGLPLTEVAEILGIPYGTAASRLHHALRAMRAAIEAGERTVVQGGQPA
jgi:RNA polymerase sigma-70 factor (ECF subfamily)